MKFAFLLYETPEAFARRTSDESEAHLGAWGAYFNALQEAGVFAGHGSALQIPETAKTVRQSGDQRNVQDGPYADTKEQLGGIFLLEAASLDEALNWAARCPACSTGGAVEVRPVWGMESI